MQIHHIVPEAEGGDSNFENGIPLCLNCHADAESYNPSHPIGRKLSRSELRRHRDQWFEIASRPLWEDRTVHVLPLGPQSEATVDELVRHTVELELWRPEVLATFFPGVLGLAPLERAHLVDRLAMLLDSEDEQARWNAALVVEKLSAWDPTVISLELLDRMSHDSAFAVRSCAAVAYHELAASAPRDVPLEALHRLAAWNEDWYVQTPATNALLRLARARPVALEVLAAGLLEEEPDAQLHSAEALDRAITVAPGALREELAVLMCTSDVPRIREVGERWKQTIEARRENRSPADAYPF